MTRASRYAFVLALAALAGTACTSTAMRSEYRPPNAARARVRTAAVLPLENLTAMPSAGKLAADALATELASHRWKVVDRDRAEQVLGQLDVVPGGTIDRIAAMRAGELLGVDAVVFGSVAEAVEGDDTIGPRQSEIGLSLKVLDVRSGQWLLAGSYVASGGDEAVSGAARRAAEEVGKAVGE